MRDESDERLLTLAGLVREWSALGSGPAQVAGRYRCDVQIVERLHAGQASIDDYGDFFAARAEFLDVEPLDPLWPVASWPGVPWDARLLLGLGAVNLLTLLVLLLVGWG